MEPVFLDLTALKLRGRRVKLYYQKNIWAFSYLPIVQSIQKANNNKNTIIMLENKGKKQKERVLGILKKIVGKKIRKQSFQN